ncbi:MAG: hypothetical protein L0J79_01605, partial [Propionibacterium sp.]|nr:hypothetical protein [Propionibacterium sp.]
QRAGVRDIAPTWLWWTASCTGAIALMIYHIKVLLGSPESFSQTFDAIFHLNAVRWIVEHGNGSSLTMAMTSGDAAPSFYPLAWHDLASLVMMTTGTSSPAAATNAVIMAVAALVWVAGCMYLAATVMEGRPSAIVAAGFFTSAFPSFPYRPLTFGVLYPNFLGIALLPGLLALVASVAGLGRGVRVPAAGGVVVLLFSLAGVSLAHPNAVLLLLVLCWPILLTWGWRAWWAPAGHGNGGGSRRPLILSAMCVGTLLLLLSWVVLRPPASASTWQPPVNGPAALGAALTLAPMSGRIPWVVALAVLAGIIYVIRTRTMVWLVGAHAILVFLWMVVASWSFGPVRTALTGGWYNDPNRIAAALPVTGFPLAVIGCAWGTQVLVDRLGSWNLGGRRIAYTTVEPVVALALVPFFLFTTQAVEYLRIVIGQGAAVYRITPESPLVDSDEYALLRKLPSLVPEGVAVAAVPFNGSSMAYALEGVETTTTHMFFTSTPDQDVLNQTLSRLAVNPEVCRSVEKMDVGYVLDFGATPVNDINDWAREYPGFMRLSTTPGLTEVAREGHAVLYRIDGCPR